MAHKVGDTVTMTSDAIENYGSEWDGVELTIVAVSRSTADHPGYDDGVGGELYDLATSDGTVINFSLYEYELR